MAYPTSRSRSYALMTLVIGGALTFPFSATAADDRPPALKKGIAAVSSGDHETATVHLGDVIKSNKRSKEHLAYAFLYRAKAYLAMGRPALALSDIDSALWLDGLPAKARTQAVGLKQKALARTGQTATITAPARRIAPTRQTLAYTAPAKAGTPVKKQPPPVAANASVPKTTPSIQPWTTRAVAAKPAPQPAAVSPKRTAAVQTTPPRIAPWVTRAKAAPTPKPPARTTPAAKPRVVRAPLPLPPPATTSAVKKVATPPRPFKTTTTREPAPRAPKPATPVVAAAPVAKPAIAAPAQPEQPSAIDVETTTRATATAEPEQQKSAPGQQQQSQVSLIPSFDAVAELTGMAQKEDDPVAVLRRAAEDAAHARRERIKRHNAALATGKSEATESASAQ